MQCVSTTHAMQMHQNDKTYNIMTIAQITKSIASSEKMIAKYNKNIDMYLTRTNKAIAKFNAQFNASFGINDLVATKGRWMHSIDVTFAGRNESNWSSCYSITDNYTSYLENKSRLDAETIRLENLRAELNRLESENAAKVAAYNTGLETALRNAMVDFRAAWMTKMMDWSRRHFQYINANKDAAQAWVKKYHNTYFTWTFRANHKSLFRNLDEKSANLCKIFGDDAAKMNEPEYLDMMEKQFADHFESCIKTMTEKCDGFAIDGNTIRIIRQDVLERGFEMLLTDASGIMVDARIIWCAEYSELVSPHTRYIVTKRNN